MNAAYIWEIGNITHKRLTYFMFPIENWNRYVQCWSYHDVPFGHVLLYTYIHHVWIYISENDLETRPRWKSKRWTHMWRVRGPWAIQEQWNIWNCSRPSSRPLASLTCRSFSPLNLRLFIEDIQRQLNKPRVVPLHCVLELRCRLFQLNHRSRCQLCA